MQPTLGPNNNTGRVDRVTSNQPSLTAAPPMRPPTVANVAPPARGGLMGAILGGGLGIILGGLALMALIIVCGIGGYFMLPTPTPTPKPTLAPTFTPEPTAVSYLLFDDFSDQNSGWEYGKGDVSDIEYANGEYSHVVFQTGWFVWGNPPKANYSNISTQVNARLVKSNYKDILFGVMCDFQDNQHYYYAGIAADGYYGIAKRSGNNDTILTGNGKLALSTQMAQGSSWYRLNFDCASDGQITLYVDGQQIATVKDAEFTTGNIGLFTNVYAPATGNVNQPANVEVHFDDLTVTQLP